MNKEIAESLRLLEINAGDAATLKEMKPMIEANLPGVLGGFYKFLGEWDNLRVMFRGQQGMDYARNAQIKHWGRICDATFNEEYMDSVRRIGLTHHRLNLEPKWYLGGYSYITTRVVRAIVERGQKKSLFGKADPRTADYLDAFLKAVFLDMTYAISIYLDEGKAEKQRLVEKLSEGIEQDIGSIASGIAAEMKSLEGTAKSLHVISGSASQGSAQVAAASEIASANVNAVAVATEEISHSVTEMRNTMNRAYEMMQTSVRQVDEVGQTVNALIDAVSKIAHVSDVIGEIAQQTNLLALNATIEAARAGEAGKGFAVVANEVKALANQTASSTEQISNEIAAIQAISQGAQKSIEGVVRTIHQISDYAVGMNNGMQEQAQAIAEIARNVDEAAKGAGEVTRNVSGLSSMSRQTESASSDVLHSARNMTEKADELENTLKAFLGKMGTL